MASRTSHGRPMNVVVVVVDSLRSRSLGRADTGGPRTPFLDWLGGHTLAFRRAYAAECWTLPSHVSMFTGLLPSDHGAHFQTMAYQGAAPTVAEVLAKAGVRTEVITRNSLLDGTVPGVTRGFVANTRLLGEIGGRPATLLFGLLLAISKPRVRRLIRSSGFFHALQKENGTFLTTLARMGIPADQLVLDRALERMAELRRARSPYFLFLNLYDVHAPYSPQPGSPLASFRTIEGWLENLMLPWVLPRVSSHAYLRPGFRLAARSQAMLLGRYHRAIELMDRKLAAFHDAARGAGLLEDTMLVVTSDHGEAFGDHELYFHDASVYQTHLHVPLWIHHPDRAPAVVDDVVSTRELCGLVRAVGTGRSLDGTLLDAAWRRGNPVALAEHFHYPFTDGLLPAYTQNLAAAIVGDRKAILRRDGLTCYDLSRDPDEAAPVALPIAEFEAACRRDGQPSDAIANALAHLGRWERAAAVA